MNLSARAVAAGTALASSATGELVLERQYILLRSSVNLALSTGDLESVRCHLRHLFVLVHTHPEWAAKAMAGSDYLAEIVQRPLYGLEMRANDRHLTIGSGNGASLGDWMAKLVRSGKRQSTLNRTPPKPLAFTSLQDITDFLHSLQDSVWRIELGVQRASQRCVDDFLMRRPLLRRGLDLSMKECLKSCVSRFVALDAGLRKRIEDTLRGFEIWRDAFDGLMKSDSVVVARHHLLIIQAFCAHFRLVACRVIEEIGWDRHYQVFVQQIAVVTEYLRLGEYVDTTECGPPRQRPHYHSTFGEWGVLRALYLICTKCRDPNTRRKSAQLLAGARWDEGTLSSTVLANYSKAIFGAEEGRAGGISEEALVSTSSGLVKGH
ncbi:hypothetical protein BDY17DRAFT_54053 [Neohortaea acidophila]|uniref:Uncharacterized protein n=1 Tax=Neohortaea acidophila TaxID=245834 RepID=A0A6A6PH36_9PEZI|nr:uncharacterized protein BDY17DRAFT_54053 [Neohortaea acidophila]KAF2479309.1 hypothetical protein BDY17DRAFT_54053 [Neohortaea acidophila]